ncbi:MAG: hypothetical protein HONDAALG_01586 [Gammaproteobacteria bacterium]|nr:hypothetical protein [Gammaproteobacteria bacterium]
MNNATTQTFTSVLDRQVHILLAHIAAIEREVRALGGGDEMIAAMCEPYHDLLKSIYTEEYPIAKAIEESDLPLQQERVSIVGEVREMDLDARRFELRHVENLRANELRCVYRQISDGEAAEWLNKQVEVTGTVVSSGAGISKLLAVDSVVILK